MPISIFCFYFLHVSEWTTWWNRCISWVETKKLRGLSRKQGWR